MASDENGGFLHKVKLVGAIVLAVLALVVMVQNRDPVDTKILFFSFTMPRALLLLLTFALGWASAMLVGWWRSPRKS